MLSIEDLPHCILSIEICKWLSYKQILRLSITNKNIYDILKKNRNIIKNECIKYTFAPGFNKNRCFAELSSGFRCKNIKVCEQHTFGMVGAHCCIALTKKGEICNQPNTDFNSRTCKVHIHRDPYNNKMYCQYQRDNTRCGLYKCRKQH
jgi:hypothetical protein